jgi:hypothetical protein
MAATSASRAVCAGIASLLSSHIYRPRAFRRHDCTPHRIPHSRRCEERGHSRHRAHAPSHRSTRFPQRPPRRWLRKPSRAMPAAYRGVRSLVECRYDDTYVRTKVGTEAKPPVAFKKRCQVLAKSIPRFSAVKSMSLSEANLMNSLPGGINDRAAVCRKPGVAARNGSTARPLPPVARLGRAAHFTTERSGAIHVREPFPRKQCTASAGEIVLLASSACAGWRPSAAPRP